MLLKVNNEFLDFNKPIVRERQSKLLSDVSEYQSSYSYDFEIEPTKKNKRILGITSINEADKSTYQYNDTFLFDNHGLYIDRGSLRVEVSDSKTISASFYSGTNEWASLLEGNVSDLDLFSYGVDGTDRASIVATWSNTEGLIYSLVNKGFLDEHAANRVTVDDFLPLAYVKTVIQKIFSDQGIKLEGELFNEWSYQHLTIGNNSKKAASSAMASREVYAGISTTQAMDTSVEILVIDNTSTYPLYPGDRDLFNTSTYRYTADKPITLELDIEWNLDASKGFYVSLYINGLLWSGPLGPGPGSGGSYTFNEETIGEPIILEAGDYLEIYANLGIDTANLTNFKVRFRPIEFANDYPQFLFGDLSQLDLVVNVFNLFNVIPNYNPVTKTLTCNLFSKLKSKTSIDVSKYIKSVGKTDYSQLLEGYGKKTIFRFNQDDSEEVERYNAKNLIGYGEGAINIDNYFLPKTEDKESDFTSSISKLALGAPLSLVDMRNYSEGDAKTISSAATSGGLANFTTSAAHGFAVGDWVKLDTGLYMGIGQVSSVGTNVTFTIENLSFIATTTGQVTPIDISEEEREDAYIFLTIPNMTLTDFSTIGTIYFGSGVGSNDAKTAMPFSWFLKPNTGRNIDNVKEQLAFDAPAFNGYRGPYIKDKYFKELESLLNDPVLIEVEFTMPRSVYDSISSLTPVRIDTKEFTGLFYWNKDTGYEGSHIEFTAELIKL